jgi:hypothetical protein
VSAVVALPGAHHIRTSGGDVEVAVGWFADLLAYEKEFSFKADAWVTGWELCRPNGGPSVAVVARRDPTASCLASTLSSREAPKPSRGASSGLGAEHERFEADPANHPLK